MRVVVHPYAPSGTDAGRRLRLWVGVFGPSSTPALSWELDGRAVAPVALRSIASARPVPRMASGSLSRAFTGLYEVRDVPPGSVHRVRVEASADGTRMRSPVLRVRTLPAAVPQGLASSFNVLMVSCFHDSQDQERALARLVAQLPAAHQPDLTLLMGDQVYLDVPVWKHRESDVVALADEFERTYRDNWGETEGYGRVLDAAPSAAIPDDHEYWDA